MKGQDFPTLDARHHGTQSPLLLSPAPLHPTRHAHMSASRRRRLPTTPDLGVSDETNNAGQGYLKCQHCPRAL
uniref:(California timema) hypothetical protein n=1 Tax=Timema californicum TaxID=61474 RepID=A0A7R9JE51_TIMCA|nr:unnamed protein product [Timema californicum]